MFKFTIPSIIFLATIIVFLQGCNLNEVPIPCTTILSIQPSSAKAGETVSIIGNNFISGKPGLYKVSIGNTNIPDSNIIDVTENILRFKVPVGVGNGLITITSNLIPNCQIISKDTFTYYYSATRVQTFSGTYSTTGCSGKASNCLNHPIGIALDVNKQHLIVADNYNNLIHIIPLVNGGSEIILGQYPSSITCGVTELTKSSGLDVYFRSPIDVEVSADVIYVAENENHTIRILQKNNNGIGLGRADILAGNCSAPGTTPGANCRNATRLNNPNALSADGNTLYFSDNGIIRSLQLDNLGACNSVSNISNNLLTEHFYTSLEISRAIKNQGPIYIADIVERKIKSMRIDGNTSDLTSVPSAALEPIALAIDSRGNIFIATNNSIYVFYNTARNLITLAGTGEPGYTPDSDAPLSSKFNKPSGLAIDESGGALYVSDTYNNVIRKISFK
jgi:DNA-binding beta-propeller fold protein YncE